MTKTNENDYKGLGLAHTPKANCHFEIIDIFGIVTLDNGPSDLKPTGKVRAVSGFAMPGLMFDAVPLTPPLNPRLHDGGSQGSIGRVSAIDLRKQNANY